MIVGSNERRYAWMDEGFNTYINSFANEARYPGQSAYPLYLRNWQDAVTHGNAVSAHDRAGRHSIRPHSARLATASRPWCC